MRFLTLSALAAAALFLASPADAARWCAGAGQCSFASKSGCERASGRPCYRLASRPARSVSDAPGPSAPASAPNRPYWSSPYECFTDEGGGRFRPCNAGGLP